MRLARICDSSLEAVAIGSMRPADRSTAWSVVAARKAGLREVTVGDCL
jgi:hypothetical protein